jgi:hypothetical protein
VSNNIEKGVVVNVENIARVLVEHALWAAIGLVLLEYERVRGDGVDGS